MMLSRRSISIATQPIPPSLIAIRRSGYFAGQPLHSHSAHDVIAIGPNIVAPSSSIGAPAGICAKPDEPLCRFSTVCVSAHARMIGSQYASNTGGSFERCGCSGIVTARKPRAALRRISAAPFSGSVR